MESDTHKAVVNYLKLQYPQIIFRSDSGAGMKLSIGQAKKQKAIQNGMKWPDLFIAEARGDYHGLFIELKDYGVKLMNKAGKPASKHIAEQFECLTHLTEKGYFATFAVGFDGAKRVIDNYMRK